MQFMNISKNVMNNVAMRMQSMYLLGVVLQTSYGFSVMRKTYL